MDALPFFLEHGDLLWKAGLGVSLLAGLLWGRSSGWLRARRHASRTRALVGKPLDSLSTAEAGAKVTLRGVLRASGQLVERFEDGALVAAARVAQPGVAAGIEARASHLELEVDGELVSLRGALSVALGSRELVARRALGRLPWKIATRISLARRPEDPSLDRGPILFQSLKAGDRVRVTGALRRELAEGSAYRHAAGRWVLDGPLVAAAERVRKKSEPLWRSWPYVVASGATFMALLGLAGAVAKEGGKQPRYWWPDGRSRAKTASDVELAIQASSPFHRRAALEIHLYKLTSPREPSAEDQARADLVRQALGDSGSTALSWTRQGDPRRGLKVAERAKAHWILMEHAYNTGDFAKARSVYGEMTDPGPFEHQLATAAHLMAGDVTAAAQSTRRMLGTSMGQDDSLRCLADALEARAGHDDARGRLEALRGDRLTSSCLALLADLTPAHERRAVLDRRADSDGDHPWLDLLAAEADPDGTRAPAMKAQTAEEFMTGPGHRDLMWTIPALDVELANDLVSRRTEPTPEERRVREPALRRALLFSLWAGRDHDADLYARRLREDAEALPAGETGDAAVRASGELRSLVAALWHDPSGALERETDAARTEVDALSDDRLRATLGERMHRPGSLLQAFARQDDTAIADLLWYGRGWDHLAARLGAGHLSSGRHDAISRALHKVEADVRSYPVDPKDLLFALTGYAAVASALHDDDYARELRMRADHFYRGLTRRETALPLAVLFTIWRA